MQEIEALAQKIKTWDCHDVEELLELLNELQTLIKDYDDDLSLEAFIDMTQLPSAIINGRDASDVNDAANITVWAMDKHRFCLVGADANEIKHITDILDY